MMYGFLTDDKDRIRSQSLEPKWLTKATPREKLLANAGSLPAMGATYSLNAGISSPALGYN